MRFLTASLLALGLGSTFFGGVILGGSMVAHAETPPPTKTIQIWNNEPASSSTRVYPVLEVVDKPLPAGDNWMTGWFLNPSGGQPDGVTVKPGSFVTTRLYRLYVNAEGVPAQQQKPGIGPGEAVEVTLPFFTRLAPFPPNPATNDQYIDWWNGGRTYVYDDPEALTRFAADKIYTKDFTLPAGAVSPSCKFLGVNSWKTCTLKISYNDPTAGIPVTDLNQLTEYTFASTITTTWPYSQILGMVGYNISSVDSTYVPVAMAPVRNNLPPIPYIGTNMALTTFRGILSQWKTAFPGWPLFNTGDVNKPRIPGGYNAFTYGFTDPSKVDKNCATDTNKTVCSTLWDMIAIYDACLVSTSGICQYYNPLINNPTNFPSNPNNGLFYQNYKTWLTFPCRDMAVKGDDITFTRKIYGFVPYNETPAPTPSCNPLANSLKSSAPDEKTFQQLLSVNYVTQLQQVGSFTPQPPTNKPFNPYVLLIGPPYLNEAAYAFSVDDDIGFQSYTGSGIIITFSGDGKTCPGIPLCVPLDRNKRVEFTLSELRIAPPVAQWASVGFCDGSVAPVDPIFPSFVFYPQSAPCHMTINDLAGQLYQFDITALPQQSPPNPQTAVGGCKFPRLQLVWCATLQVDQTKGPFYNYINAGATTPGPVPSSHDFDGNGYSDLLLIDSNTGNASIWLLQTTVPIDMGGLGNLSGFTSVGQHDFDRDGKADLLWRSTDGNGQVFLWMMNGKSIVPEQPIVPPATKPPAYQQWAFGAMPTWNVVGTGDFNGSGLGSILWKDTGDNYALWNLNSAAQQVVGLGVLGNVPSSQWRVAGLGDFDHDGMSDILWQGPAGDLAIWFMINTSVKFPQGIGSVGPNWIVVGTGDFDGDGNADILFRYNNPNNANDPSNGMIAIWLMNGAAVKSSGGPGALDPKWSVTLTGDYNRDGKSDILLRYNNAANAGDPLNGLTAIWFMNGLNVASVNNLGIIPTNFKIQNANAE